MIDKTAVMIMSKEVLLLVMEQRYLLCYSDQVIYGKSSCAEFMKEAYTPIIYHNK